MSRVLRLWLPVGLLWGVAVLNYFDRLMITSMRDPIKETIAMTDAQFGLLTSVFLWVYGAASPLGGFLADRFGRSRVIVASLAVWSALTWLTGHARTLDELLAARALMGVSEACYIPAALALIADYHRDRTRSLAVGIHMSGLYAGTALGGLGGYLAEWIDWRHAFSACGLVGLVYGGLLIALLRDVPSPAPLGPKGAAAPASPWASLFTTPGFWMLAAISVLVGVANWTIYGWLPTYLRDRYSLGLGAAGLSATGYIQIASFFGVLGGGLLADRWSRATSRGRILLPAWGFLAAGPLLLLAISSPGLMGAILGLMVYGVARGFFDANLMPILRQTVDERCSATGYGIFNFVACLAGGGMIYLGGFLKDSHHGLAAVFQLAAGGIVLAAFLLFAVKTRPIAT